MLEERKEACIANPPVSDPANIFTKRMDECYMRIIEGRRLTLLKELKRHGRNQDLSWQVFFLP